MSVIFWYDLRSERLISARLPDVQQLLPINRTLQCFQSCDINPSHLRWVVPGSGA